MLEELCSDMCAKNPYNPIHVVNPTVYHIYLDYINQIQKSLERKINYAYIIDNELYPDYARVKCAMFLL